MSGISDSPGKARARGASELPLPPREAEYFDKLLHLFCANRRGTHGYADSTIRMYRSCMKRSVRAIGCPPWAWNPRDVDLLLSALAERGVATGTQLGIITVLRAFQNYVLDDIGLCNEIQHEFGVRPQRFITSNNSIPYQRQGRNRSTLITPLTPEHCEALLDEFQFQIDVARRHRSKAFQPLRRNYAITVVALSYGLRVAELAGIELTHFQGDAAYPTYGQFALLRVIGKGEKPRTVRLYAPSVPDLLTWYIEHVRAAFLTKATTNPNLLFLSERGCALCPRQYRRSLSEVAAAAGLPTHVYPHLLRHTYATEMAQVIGPEELQKQLGHKHLSTTLSTYYHPDPQLVGNKVADAVESMMAAFDEVTQNASHAHHR